VHYPQISKVVRQVCAERNIAYVEHTTFRKAVAAHARHLHAMGRPDRVTPALAVPGANTLIDSTYIN